MMRLWRANLYHSCKKCNGALGDRIYWSVRAVQLLGVYVMIKTIGMITEGLAFAFLLALLYKDLTSGPLDTTFSAQILIETIEAVEKL